MPTRFLIAVVTTTTLLLLSVLSASAGEIAGEGAPSLIALFGRAHIVMVHFPVALMMVLALLEIVRWRRPLGSCDNTVVVLAVISGLSAVTAVIQGWVLAGPPSDKTSEYAQLIELHRWLGVSTAVIAVATALLALARQFGDSARLATCYRFTVLPGALLVSLTGHYGGAAMHGKDHLPLMPWEMWHLYFGNKSTATNSASSAATAPTPNNQAVSNKIDFARDIHPIFVKNCYECHDEKEDKGGLRMDTRELLLKGGDSGPGIIPGDGKKSNLVIRLFDGEEPRMPKKKPALPPEQIALITAWIDQGAEWSPTP
jgi:uncharacterized membrane protein